MSVPNVFFWNPKFVPKLALCKNLLQIFENEKQMTPVQHLASVLHLIYILHHFLLPEISPTLCSDVQNLVTQKHKNAFLTNSLLTYYPWPIQIQKYPKDPNLKFIFCEIGVHMLLADAAFWWLGLVALFRSLKNSAPYNSATSSYHLKIV